MRPVVLRWAAAKMDANPGFTIASLTDSLNEHFGTSLARQTVNKWENQNLQYQLKLLRYEVPENNAPERIAARKLWCKKFLAEGENLAECIHVDEAGFNVHLTRRLGRAGTGYRPRQQRPQDHGRNLTLLVAVGREGIIVARLHWGSFCRPNFQSFVMTDVVPWLQRPRTIICDNAQVHKGKELEAALLATTHKLDFLPAYSPYLDCAEWVFGSVKPFVKRQEVLNASNLEVVVTARIERTAEEHAAGWMREVTRDFQRALAGKGLGTMYNNPSLPQHPFLDADNDSNVSDGQQNGGCIRNIIG